MVFFPWKLIFGKQGWIFRVQLLLEKFINIMYKNKKYKEKANWVVLCSSWRVGVLPSKEDVIVAEGWVGSFQGVLAPQFIFKQVY